LISMRPLLAGVGMVVAVSIAICSPSNDWKQGFQTRPGHAPCFYT
jgi:hypothetical protein